MAQVYVACRLSLSVLFVFVPVVTNHVDSLLVYDRQALLNIRHTTENLVKFNLHGQNAFPLPDLSGIPAHLRHAPAPPSRRKRPKRRGKHSRLQVKLKAYLALLPRTNWKFLHGISAAHGLLHRRFVSCWHLAGTCCQLGWGVEATLLPFTPSPQRWGKSPKPPAAETRGPDEK